MHTNFSITPWILATILALLLLPGCSRDQETTDLEPQVEDQVQKRLHFAIPLLYGLKIKNIRG